MKKLALNIEYQGKNITSDYAELNKNEQDTLIELCQKAARGDLSYLSISQYNKTFFIPKEIIKHSIITIVQDNS